MLTASQIKSATATAVHPLGLGKIPASGATAERREASRISTAPTLRVVPLGGTNEYRCQADNLSEGGLYVKMSTDCTLSVGQRCEVTFTEQQPMAAAASLAGLTCYATVVRTEQLIASPKPLVGAGLRFDRPLFL